MSYGTYCVTENVKMHHNILCFYTGQYFVRLVTANNILIRFEGTIKICSKAGLCNYCHYAGLCDYYPRRIVVMHPKCLATLNVKPL